MRTMLFALLLQALAAPDPAQMEKAPDLGYVPVEYSVSLPGGVALGSPTSIAMTAQGQLMILRRADDPLVVVDGDGHFVRSLGIGAYTRPHGMRLDPQGNVWITDVREHTVTKLDQQGKTLLVLGVKNQAGNWDEGTQSRLLNEPTDLGFGRDGSVFVSQGHGGADARVLKFDKTGAFLTQWGSKGAGPGQFDIPHSVVVDAKGVVYVADRQNRRVQLFDANGKYIKEWKYAGLPCGLYLSADQQMYLLTGYSGQILKLDVNGKAIAATGQPGKGLGEFGEAHYMSIGPNGEIYVADTVGVRLHKFVKKM